MPEFIDYSSRRGAIVPLLPQVHALIKELAQKDTAGTLSPPDLPVSWKRTAGQALLDTNRRFLFAIDLTAGRRDVWGYIFYRFGAGDTIYIEDMQIAWKHRRNTAVVTGLLTKLEQEPRAKAAVFFGSEKIKLPPDKEILAGVGFRDNFPDGWEPLGNLKDTIGTLKARYMRTKTT